ncbi:Transcriptional regulator of ribosomal biogenesis proteins [Rhizophlyctis rosea]|nr:Transcriptional regulator of ribosomal biogenesis proteins [Rhizophlyctis rosea]
MPAVDISVPAAMAVSPQQHFDSASYRRRLAIIGSLSKSLGHSFGRAGSLSRNSYVDMFNFQFGARSPMIASPSRDLAHFAGLEDKFCKDFACCGVQLENLHDLLQHFEECHVRVESDIEDDEDLPFEFESMDDMDTDMSDDSSPANAPVTFTDIFLKSQLQLQPSQSVALSDIYSESKSGSATAAFDQRKRMVATGPPRVKKVRSINPQDHTGTFDGSSQSGMDVDMDDVTPTSIAQQITPTPIPQPVQPLHAPRLLNPTTPVPLAAPAFANPAITPLPAGFDPALAAAAQAAAQQQQAPGSDLNMEGVIMVEDQGVAAGPRDDRPYKCKVVGCYKAYKNPGGLKYHMQHGHCEDTGDPEMNNIIHKPYQCTVPECGKRYKNLNGLKYHIEHAHISLLGPCPPQ